MGQEPKPEGVSARPWSVPVTRHQVPETGRRFELTADAPTRAAVATLAGVESVPRLEASFEVVQHGSDGVRVVGRVSGTVGQVCVVTLEPIEGEVEELVDMVFVPGAVGSMAADGELAVDVDDVNFPEPLVNGGVDLGVIAVEFLILGIDPYPRKPDAVFEAPPPGTDAGSPFALLAALKKGRDKDDG
jgi:hypothetical protein